MVRVVSDKDTWAKRGKKLHTKKKGREVGLPVLLSMVTGMPAPRVQEDSGCSVPAAWGSVRGARCRLHRDRTEPMVPTLSSSALMRVSWAQILG